MDISRPVTNYRIEVQRDGAWWEITSWVTRLTLDSLGNHCLYVREPLPVSVPAPVRVSWQETVSADAWASMTWARIAERRGIHPGIPYEAEITGTVPTILVDPDPPVAQPPATLTEW